MRLAGFAVLLPDHPQEREPGTRRRSDVATEEKGQFGVPDGHGCGECPSRRRVPGAGG